MILGLRNTRGTADPFTITSLKTMRNEKFQIIFRVEVHAGDSRSLHDHQPKNHEKWKISNDFWVEEHAGYNWSLHDHQPKNHEKNFWVEVHAGTAENLKNHENKKVQMIFGLRYTRGLLIPSRSPAYENHEKMKKFSDYFLSWGTRGVHTWYLHLWRSRGVQIPSRSPAWKMKNHEVKIRKSQISWKMISDDFWVDGTRVGQLIPSRSPSWKQ